MRKLILFYTIILMILSQTPFAKSVIFLSIPLLISLVIRNTKINKFGFKKIFFLNLILFTGFISGMIHLAEYDMYFFARDIIYFIQAPMYIILGFYLYKEVKDLDSLLKSIVLTSFVITLYKLTELIVDPSILLRLGLETRYGNDLSNATALFAFVILFYARKVKYKLFNRYVELFIMMVSLFSIAVSFSRTFYALLLITMIIPYLENSRKVLKMYGVSVVLVLFVVFGGEITKVESKGSQITSFQEKVMNSFNEITVKEYKSHRDINEHWRGYEAYLGLSKYYEGSLVELLFGQGYGTVVKTPNWVFQGEKLDILPIFHNGYITIILKTGLVGLLFFFLFLWIILRTAIKANQPNSRGNTKLGALLLQASVFIVFFQTFVIHGIFKTTVPMLLLVLIGVVLQLVSVNQSKNIIDGIKQNG